MAQRRRTPRRKTKKSADLARTRRVTILYGLTGIFTLVVGGLVLVRPRPLAAQAEAAPLPRTSAVLAATHAEPIDVALEASVRRRPWTRLTVRHLSAEAARLANPHFALVQQAGEDAQLVVGRPWLDQRPAAGADPEELLVVIVGDAATLGQTPETFVRQLCERLSITAHGISGM